jgi:hypothetical protein
MHDPAIVTRLVDLRTNTPHADCASKDFGGCNPGLLAQRSRFSMTLAWLGRLGGGHFGSSESLRGSLTFSVMGALQDENMRPNAAEINT